MQRMRKVLPALWLCFGSAVLFAEEGAPAKRLSVAVLGFENKTGDPELGHWRQGFETLLSEQLWKVKSLRQRRGMSFAFQQLGFKSGSPLDAAQAKKMGEIIEAQRVVWGSYQREGEKWQVTVRVLNVVTGKVSADLTVTTRDWWDIRDGLAERLLKELGVEPSGEERRQMGKRWTQSPKALEALSRTLAAARDSKEPLDEIERQAR